MSYWADVREGLENVGRELRPALAKAVLRVAYWIDPGMAGVIERTNGELEIVIRGVTVATITPGSVGGVRYGRRPGA